MKLYIVTKVFRFKIVQRLNISRKVDPLQLLRRGTFFSPPLRRCVARHGNYNSRQAIIILISTKDVRFIVLSVLFFCFSVLPLAGLVTSTAPSSAEIFLVHCHWTVHVTSNRQPGGIVGMSHAKTKVSSIAALRVQITSAWRWGWVYQSADFLIGADWKEETVNCRLQVVGHRGRNSIEFWFCFVLHDHTYTRQLDTQVPMNTAMTKRPI